MRLSERVFNQYSQFGEDGCIDHIFERIGISYQVAVEFGAGDGVSCSNTANLWHEQEWHAFLVEPEDVSFQELRRNAEPFSTTLIKDFVAPEGPKSIAAMVNTPEIDFMSIDVDGDDYFILEKLTIRPRVISIEFNPTIPPHIELRQSGLGETFGASLLAIVRLAEQLDYQFIGATYCNAFLVDKSEAAVFDEYDTDLESLFPPNQYTYAVTDFAGRVVLCGQELPWEAKEPYVVPLEGSPVFSSTNSPDQIRLGFESVWGPAQWMTLGDFSAPSLPLSQAILGRVLYKGQVPLVCIDLTYASLKATSWMWDIAKQAHYRPLLMGRVLGLVREENI